MAADIHPPVLTDVIANPAYHSMEAFWTKWGVTHGDLNNVMQHVARHDHSHRRRVVGEEQTGDHPEGTAKFLGGGRIRPLRTRSCRPWGNTAAPISL